MSPWDVRTNGKPSNYFPLVQQSNLKSLWLSRKLLQDLAPASLMSSRFAAKSLQSDSRPPGSAVPGILQARTLEWVAIFFSNAWKWKVKVKLLSKCLTSWPQGLQPTRPLRPWDFPGKSTAVGCHCLLRSSRFTFHQICLPSVLASSNILLPQELCTCHFLSLEHEFFVPILWISAQILSSWHRLP